MDYTNNQAQRILAHLRKGHSITPVEALEKFDCFRLGARIFDLKQDGHDIIKTMVTEANGKSFARYTLIQNRDKGAA